MPMAQNEIGVIGGTQIAVGLSQVIRVVAGAFQYSTALKIGAGGGTLEIVPPQLSGSSTAAGNAWGKGYGIGANEIINWDGSAAIYLAATGATMTAWLMNGYTYGATVL